MRNNLGADSQREWFNNLSEERKKEVRKSRADYMRKWYAKLPEEKKEAIRKSKRKNLTWAYRGGGRCVIENGMKICQSGKHRYDVNIKQCPYCRKERNQSPENRKKQKEYRDSEHRKEWTKEYYKTHARPKSRKRAQTPEFKKWMKEYLQRPKVKERISRYTKSERFKEVQKAYRHSEKGKASQSRIRKKIGKRVQEELMASYIARLLLIPTAKIHQNPDLLEAKREHIKAFRQLRQQKQTKKEQ